MESLTSLDLLTVREKKNYDGFPADRDKPLGCLVDCSEQVVYYVMSERGAATTLAGLRKAHAFMLSFMEKGGEEKFYLEKRTGLFENKVEIFDAGEVLLGSIQRHGAAKTSFRALDAAGQLLYEIEGASALPEIFSIRRGTVPVGKISRRPARIVEEGIPQSDHFGIVFPLAADEAEKGVLLGALLLIDLLF